PQGLGRERDEVLNAALEAALQPIADAAQALGAQRADARLLMVDTFAHAAGLLLLAHTGRLRLFGASAPTPLAPYVGNAIRGLGAKRKAGAARRGGPRRQLAGSSRAAAANAPIGQLRRQQRDGDEHGAE